MSKGRLTVSVDRRLVEAGAEAVAEGRAGSVSAWVNLALAERAEKDRRLRALADAVADYERAFGAMTGEELTAQERVDRAAARVVRGGAMKPLRRRGAA
jgi:hypothetical protein